MEVHRTEHKFILTRTEAAQLAYKLNCIMPKDAYCTEPEGYEIRSLYFDTLSDRCYVEKADGLLVHEKFRARIYGTDDRIIKLERKHKLGEHQTKQSLLISRPLLEELSQGRYSGLLDMDEPLSRFFYQKLSRGMLPKSIVQYKRLSFCVDTNNTRITFDSDIRATETCTDLFRQNLPAHPILPPNRVVLEVKFNNFLLSYVQNALNSIEKLPASFSKYANGRDFTRTLL